MNTAKPFTWIVKFTVSPVWVADGFALGNDRATDMIAHALPYADGSEFEAVTIEAPKAQDIAKVQGYTKGTGNFAKAIAGLEAETQDAGDVRSALLKARALLDSVAYVASEGDTVPVLAQIDHALAYIDARQGAPIALEA